jgi:hypothetical protein
MATNFSAAIKAALAPTRSAVSVAVKASESEDDDGVIITRLSVADVRDRENERVTEAALKAAVWELAMKASVEVSYDFNHLIDGVECDLVGVYYDYAEKAAVIHLRPHDRAVYEAAKCGEIIGMSWSGPYRLSEDV